MALLGAVPATSSNAAQQSDTAAKPPTTTFNPTKLAKGKTTAAYVDGKTLHDGKKTVKVKVPHDIWDVYKLRRGYLVGVDDPKTGWGIIYYRVGPKGGNATKLRRFAQGIWNLHVNTDGQRVAVNADTKDAGSKLVVFNATDNKVIRRKDLGRKELLGYSNGRTLLSNYQVKKNRSVLSWYHPGKNTTTKIGTAPDWARFADAENDVLGLGAGPGGSCYDVRRFKAPRQRLWRFCSKKGIPDGIRFSPDGKRMITTVSFHNQPKVATLTVRRVKDGSVVRRFRAPEFSSAGWENAKTIVVEAAAAKKAARVRCTIGGKCTRVSRLVKGVNNFRALDNLDTMFVGLKLLI